MKTIRILAAAAALLALVPLSQAQQAPVGAEADLRAFSEGLESLSGSFRQITVEPGGEVVDESAGRLYFEAPDRIRWDYSEPFPQLIVADGETLWHYDEALEQVTKRPQPPAEESPMLVITRPELLERFYRVLPSDDPRQLRFEPLAEESEFELARLTFVDGLPFALDLFDRFGQSTRLQFEGLERNPELDARLFTFEPPEGADVLEGL
ncbi:MAG: outer membrane lipoprotein chaperone LolA [Wenzhouxiangellaceae bacterium]|nr:outer membrane lipoprotein chaperone LolA [Wenzhouxiangellaceae bacterium]